MKVLLFGKRTSNIYNRVLQRSFGAPENNDFSLNEENREVIPQFSRLENDLLSEPFNEKEIKKVVFQIEHNKAPGPDGFPAKFYHFFGHHQTEHVGTF